MGTTLRFELRLLKWEYIFSVVRWLTKGLENEIKSMGLVLSFSTQHQVWFFKFDIFESILSQRLFSQEKLTYRCTLVKKTLAANFLAKRQWITKAILDASAVMALLFMLPSKVDSIRHIILTFCRPKHQQKGQVNAWQSATLLPISCKSAQPVPALVEEPVCPVAMVPRTIHSFPRCLKPVLSKLVAVLLLPPQTENTTLTWTTVTSFELCLLRSFRYGVQKKYYNTGLGLGGSSKKTRRTFDKSSKII